MFLFSFFMFEIDANSAFLGVAIALALCNIKVEKSSVIHPIITTMAESILKVLLYCFFFLSSSSFLSLMSSLALFFIFLFIFFSLAFVAFFFFFCCFLLSFFLFFVF